MNSPLFFWDNCHFRSSCPQNLSWSQSSELLSVGEMGGCPIRESLEEAGKVFKIHAAAFRGFFF